MAGVQTPVEGFNGIVAGVTFTDGVGETTDPNALAYFERHGYTVTAGEAAPELTDEEKATAQAEAVAAATAKADQEAAEQAKQEEAEKAAAAEKAKADAAAKAKTEK